MYLKKTFLFQEALLKIKFNCLKECFDYSKARFVTKAR